MDDRDKTIRFITTTSRSTHEQEAGIKSEAGGPSVPSG